MAASERNLKLPDFLCSAGFLHFSRDPAKFVKSIGLGFVLIEVMNNFHEGIEVQKVLVWPKIVSEK